MKTLDHSSIIALISLLEDPNEIIFNEIQKTIIALDVEGIIPLQKAFDTSNSELQKARITVILSELKIKKLREDLSDWLHINSNDLLAGLISIAKYGDPTLNEQKIHDVIDQIIQTIQPKIKGKDPEEIVHILNQVLLYDFGFNGNTRNDSGMNNSFINKIIETKISNPIGLSIIYLMIASALNIPLVGINAPGHFILGYSSRNVSSENIEDGSVMEHINFYIDPFNNGKTIQPDDFDYWLEQVPYKLANKKYLSANNIAIVKRVINNLTYALFISGEKTTANKLISINDLL
ncbi:transglutaminase family protein [Tenacibaculum maritimum]|uniref:transglutaminase family protein n=1 Tax=Tenacibaculum maritimum TaxID=107401 RepID=UPI0038777CE8